MGLQGSPRDERQAPGMDVKGINRRLAVGQVWAACVCLAARMSHASAFPSRPVRVLVGAAPGGPSDFMARLFSDAATAALGQNFVVENRAGASGTLAAAEAARAEPDGHTVLVAGPSTVLVAPHIVRKASFTTENFVPVALLGAGA